MRILPLILCIFLSQACTSKKETVNVTPSATVKDYDKMADGICECTKEMIRLYKELEMMNGADRQERETELKIALDTEEAKAKECVDTIVTKDDGMVELDQKQADLALHDRCPDFYNMMKVGRIR